MEPTDEMLLAALNAERAFDRKMFGLEPTAQPSTSLGDWHRSNRDRMRAILSAALAPDGVQGSAKPSENFAADADDTEWEPCYDCGRTDGGCDRIVELTPDGQEKTQ